MNVYNTIDMMYEVCDEAISSKDLLCKLDSFVGDGDHGFTVARGFSAVKNVLDKGSFNTPREVFAAVGDTLAESMGGAIGLIIGGLFSGGARTMNDSADITVDDIYKLLRNGLEEIKMIGGAKEGDRTLIDALSPACDAYKNKMDSESGLAECLHAAAIAAGDGAAGTSKMVARKGRAKFLNKESLGYVDAGSVTMQKVIEAMWKYVRKIEE
ncbi:dihydroxyacetone kinase subunit L [Muricomes sp. OA1]|uniref:phosphoenolpyruvate--glycerone phosphotransferase n=1 Tax=Hungatella hathewayi TaxID=154046 RepID=A0A3E2X1V2_9FIRM|nr:MULTISPECIES: dihydroxyacetone kinase subunit DhaL [Clostridia]MCH1971738.1 dihydroxyacetone kinase subunit L [Muricomes sp. OA1]RGC35483.1 dihydroxyacetone kinase subunit L [Hungatella hathewayi]GKH35011.1 dihydroxyacetone kinase subunit L [Faecalicatena contorta]